MPSDNSRNFTEHIIKQSLTNRLHMTATAGGVKPFNLAFTIAGGLPASKPDEGVV